MYIHRTAAVVLVSMLLGGVALAQHSQRRMIVNEIRGWANAMKLSPRASRILKAVTRESHVKKHMKGGGLHIDGASLYLRSGRNKMHVGTNMNGMQGTSPIFDLVVKTPDKVAFAARSIHRGRTFEIMTSKGSERYSVRSPKGRVIKEGSTKELYSWATDCHLGRGSNVEARTKQLKNLFGLTPGNLILLYHQHFGR